MDNFKPQFSPIHDKPEDKVARSAVQTLEAIKSTENSVTKANIDISNKLESTSEKIALTVDFQGRETKQALNLIKEEVTRKLDEVKSASLATNIILKKIEKGTSKEFPTFPSIPETDLSKTNALLTSLLEKDTDVKVILKIV